jgi:tetratricopeptide (TPR) repeat protein
MRFAGVVWCVVVLASPAWNAPAVAAATTAPAATAASTASEGQLAEARQHHAQASKLYDLAEYEGALREFKEAYRAVEDPAFLFNIAQCHRKLGHTQDAITFYRSFLRRAPHAANRAEVEHRIAELERAAPPPPPAGAPPPAATATATTTTTATPPPAPPPVAPAPPPQTSELLVAAPSNAPPPDAADQPFYRRGWFWIVAGAVVAGTATTLVVLHERSKGSPFCPDCAGTTAIPP